MIVAGERHHGVGILQWVLGLILNSKWIIAVTVGIGIIGGYVAFLSSAKRYVATAVIALDVRKVSMAPFDAVVSRLPQENPALRTELDVLSSRSMAESVIQRLGVGRLAPVLVPTTRDGSPQQRQALIDALIGSLQVSNDGRSYTIYISVTSTDPIFSAKVANSYATEYLAYQASAKSNTVRVASEWLGKKVEELRKKLEESEKAVDSGKQKNLYEAQREVAANRSLYETFLQRYKATIEQEDLPIPEGQLISEAQPPRVPSTPRLMPLMTLGIFLGAAFGMGAAFLKMHVDDRILSPTSLEDRSGLLVLGALPSAQAPGRRFLNVSLSGFLGNGASQWWGRKASRLVTALARWRVGVRYWRAALDTRIPTWSRNVRLGRWSASGDVDCDDCLQRLQAVLKFSSRTRNAKVIVVTSAHEGEGKTFVSLGLARAFAAAGSSAVVIDADLLRPAVAARCGVEPSFYWQSLMGREAPLDELIRKAKESDVDVVAGIAAGLTPIGLFTAAAFSELVTTLRARYDRVIIDAPPIAASADPAMLGALADTMLLVARWRVTTYTQLEQALRQIALYTLPVAGVVLNQVEPQAIAHYPMSSRRTILHAAAASMGTTSVVERGDLNPDHGGRIAE